MQLHWPRLGLERTALEGTGQCSNRVDLAMNTTACAMTTSPLPGLGKENIKMKHNVMLTVASLLSILFMTLHLTSDTVHARVGTAEAGGSTLIAVPVLVVWLYGTLVLAERRSGYIIMLVGSLLASGMPIIHVMGAGGVFRGQIAKSSPAFLFVWTLHALGVTGMFSLILSARGLWNLRRGQPR
jgi:hypothetical protein